MLPLELKKQVFDLSPDDRLALVSLIIDSLRQKPLDPAKRSAAIGRMQGMLATDQPAPTDEEVKAMLEQRRVEKYLQ